MTVEILFNMKNHLDDVCSWKQAGNFNFIAHLKIAFIIILRYQIFVFSEMIISQMKKSSALEFIKEPE